MASQKEEPNPSILFGESTGDDLFSQLQQQQQQQNTIPEAKEQKKPTANEQKQPQQNSNVVGDASSLFGESSNGNADLFFSSAPVQQPANQPLTANASTTASFFEQSTTQSESFFDNLGQGDTSQPAASLTQAYDPNAYASYDYSNQTNQQLADNQQQTQEYDQSQWIQFDPNQHYYYDEQGQVHYYDPNTNQEYDMSQYGYDQQGETYDYQYDPQYAEYYAQQGYDPNIYSADTQLQQQQVESQEKQQQQYDPNTYAQSQQQQQDGSYYDYDSQAYAPVNNAVAEVPAQIQSEQTIDTQHYAPQQQQQGEDYGVQQNYTPTDAEPQQQLQQQQDFNYQDYEATDLQQQYTSDNAYTQQTGNALDINYVADNNYAPVTNNQDFSQMQNEFMAEDLQQRAPTSNNKSFAPPSSASVLPSPSQMNTAAPPKSVLSPPPPKSALSPPPKNAAPPRSALSLPSQQQSTIPPPSKDVQAPAVLASTPSSHRGSYDANVPTKEATAEEEVNLDDLDDLVLGGGSVKSSDINQSAATDEIDLIMSTADYDGHNKKVENELIYNNPNAYEEPASEQTVPTQQAEISEVPKVEEKAAENYSTFEPAGQAQQPVEVKQLEQPVEALAVEPQQSKQAVDSSSHQLQQEENDVVDNNIQKQSKHAVEYTSCEPQKGEQAVDYTSYEPQQDEQAVDYTFYEPQQDEQAFGYDAYEPQQGEQSVDYISYAPQQGEQNFDYSSYAPQEQTATPYAPHDQAQEQVTFETPITTSYEPQSSYAPQEQTSIKPSAPPQRDVDYSFYLPQGQASSQPSAPPQQVADYSPYAPQESSSKQNAPPQATTYPPYAPQQNAIAQQQAVDYSPYTPLSQQINNSEQSLPATVVPLPPTSSEPLKQRAITSPPPQRRNMISPSPPTNAMMYGFQQRSNSITEPDRKQSSSPFNYYINNNNSNSGQFPAIERSATVPPPMTERIASPRPQLIACPDPTCEGENKIKAKFCCECGRPLAGISRSTTPSAAALSPGFSNDVFSPISASFGAVAERSVLDEKKDAMISSLKTFMAASPLVNADQQLALNYIDSRIGEFDENKALLWNIVKVMIQHQGSTLGDGGGLDRAILALLSTCTDESSAGLDKLESLLLNGDREASTQFAIENDMWSHALIISQSDSAEHFKRVISQFIDRELFASSNELSPPQVPSDKKSLRMLYSVFSGAGADAVLELARNSPQDHPLECTADQLQYEWKKSLSLIIGNRSSKDTEVITGLGNQLLQSGFVHCAYICYILSSGPESQIVGAQGTDIYTDLDALYLTELYEYATNAKYDKYKFIQAWWLSELGFTKESKIYCDSIVSTKDFNQLDEICNTATSENVTSLLKKSTFDILIGSISANNQGSYDNAAAETATTSDGIYNYGYGYGGGYTASADQQQEGLLQSKGIQSPFRVSTPSVAQTSPFQVANAASPLGAVRSPFGGYAAPDANESANSGWWGSEGQTAATTEPEQTTTESTSYQPDAYTPAAVAASSTAAYDDDDDLGFGNPQKKAAKEESDTKEVDQKPREEKPNEITSEDKKEQQQQKGGWGLFSLFSRKEKDPNSDEKKAVKANLGEQSSFYYDEKEKRWVNKLNDSKPAAAATPPPPKATAPKPSPLASAPPMSANTPPPPMGGPPPPIGGLKPVSTPLSRISSTPNVLGSSSGGPPSAAPPAFNTPPASRRAGGSRKPMRSRYVDVLNTPPPQN